MEEQSTLRQLDEHVAEYRAVSRLAVLGLIAGLASLLAMASPIFWVVPVLAILLCIWSLRHIRRNEDELIGRSVACLGIGLALFFAAAAFSNHFIRRVVAERQAREIADSWIGFVEEGAIRYAHQFSLPYVTREVPGVPLEPFYKEEEGKVSFANFIKEDPMKALSQLQEGDRIERLGCEDVTIQRSNRYVAYRYRLVRNEEPLMEFGISVRRFTEAENKFHSWTVKPYLMDEQVPK